MAERRGVPFCHREAVHHLLVGTDFQSRVCDQHLQAAVLKIGVTDHHSYRPAPCDKPRSEGGRWHYSTPDREGWCFVADDDERELVSIVESHSAQAQEGKS